MCKGFNSFFRQSLLYCLKVKQGLFVLIMTLSTLQASASSSTLNQKFANSPHLQKLIEHKKRPTMDMLVEAIRKDGWLDNETESKIIAELEASARVSLSIDTLSMYAFLELAFPGYRLSSLGRDAVIATEIYDALMIYAGGIRRGIRIDMSGDIARHASEESIFEYMTSIGFPSNMEELLGRTPVFILDWTSWAVGSQLKRLIQILHKNIAGSKEVNPAIFTHSLNALIPRYSDNYSMELNEDFVKRTKSGIVNNVYKPISTRFSGSRNRIWNGRFTHFVNTNGLIEPFISQYEAPLEGDKKLALLEMVELLFMVRTKYVQNELNGITIGLGATSFNNEVILGDQFFKPNPSLKNDIDLRNSMSSFLRHITTEAEALPEPTFIEFLEKLEKMKNKEFKKSVMDQIINALLFSLQTLDYWKLDLEDTVLHQILHQTHSRDLSELISQHEILSGFKYADLKFKRMFVYQNLMARKAKIDYSELLKELRENSQYTYSDVGLMVNSLLKFIWGTDLSNDEKVKYYRGIIELLEFRQVPTESNLWLNVYRTVYDSYVLLRSNTDKAKFHDLIRTSKYLQFHVGVNYNFDPYPLSYGQSYPTNYEQYCDKDGALTQICIMHILNDLSQKYLSYKSAGLNLGEVSKLANRLLVNMMKNTFFSERVIQMAHDKKSIDLLVDIARELHKNQIPIPGVTKENVQARWKSFESTLLNSRDNSESGKNLKVQQRLSTAFSNISKQFHQRDKHSDYTIIKYDSLIESLQSVDSDSLDRIVNEILTKIQNDTISIFAASEMLTQIYLAFPNRSIWKRERNALARLITSDFDQLLDVIVEKYLKSDWEYGLRYKYLLDIAVHPRASFASIVRLFEQTKMSSIDYLYKVLVKHLNFVHVTQKSSDELRDYLMKYEGRGIHLNLTSYLVRMLKTTQRPDQEFIKSALFQFYQSQSTQGDRHNWSDRDKLLQNSVVGDQILDVDKTEYFFEWDVLVVLSDISLNHFYPDKILINLTKIAKLLKIIGHRNDVWMKEIKRQMASQSFQNILANVLAPEKLATLKLVGFAKKSVDIELVKTLLIGNSDSAKDGADPAINACEARLAI